jgi:hypothetical protein
VRAMAIILAAPGPGWNCYTRHGALALRGSEPADGVKMLALATILALAGAASGALPRWLRYTGITLAVVITASGLAYLLLLASLAFLAVPAGVLLLVFITGTGLALGASDGRPRRAAPATHAAMAASHPR